MNLEDIFGEKFDDTIINGSAPSEIPAPNTDEVARQRNKVEELRR
jgi:hypothetical protein